MAQVAPPPGKPRVLIVGAGFGGMATAVRLGRVADAKVTLINHRNYHLFTPLLYQTATGLVDMDHLAQTIRPQARSHGFEFFEGDVTSVDLDARVARTSFGDLSYDYLVVAVGAVNNDFGIKGVAEHTLPLKTLNDGELMHNKIVGSMESAAVAKDPAARRALLTFVVIGGGPTGVELAGSIRDYVKLMQKDYPEVAEAPRVILIEALPTLLPGISEYMVRKTAEALAGKGVQIRTSCKVVEVSEVGVHLEGGEVVESANVFWTAGVKPAPLVAALDVEKERGRVKVDGFLRVSGHPEVYALGDAAYCTDPATGARLAETGQVAFQQAKWLAKALPEVMVGRSVPPFAYHHRGLMLSLGRNSGVADLGWLRVSGFLGWFIWRVVHLSQISASRNRLGVVFDWTFAYFNRRNIAHTDG
jgi:NADH:quinone reductase (non-electrogenic)